MIKKLCYTTLIICFLSGCERNDQAGIIPDFDKTTPRYEASFLEGIDFAKPGYPNFLAGCYGLSGLESWGRWTDGPVIKFYFKRRLPRKFTLQISAGAPGYNIGKMTTIRVGNTDKVFTIKDAMATSYSVSFEGIDDNIHLIEMFPPTAVNLKHDSRALGLAMVNLKIQ